ncbi:MAG: helix-turn-helix transcriptional regulator [Collinsella sp.]|nr:helix-turn-helix transcriptional regulator [Collinsella sp.]
MDIRRKEFGEGLAERRRYKSLTEGRDIKQSELARAVGVRPSTLNMYENGKALPSILTAYKLAAFFGTTIDDLVGPFIGESGEEAADS